MTFKRSLIVSAIISLSAISVAFLFSGVSVMAATGGAFSTDMGVGATGPSVSALQTLLISGGFHIPSIENGLNPKGRFGSQTKKAVQQYQIAHKISATGFVGPITRASLNGITSSSATSTPMIVSHILVVASTSTSPASVITTIGTAGTLATSLWSSPSDGTVVYKGQSYDVVAYKLQAAASDMAVQSISLDFNTRLWLYASTITLKDDTGAVVGQVSNLNSSNFSELTVGSDYRVTIPISNYVVKATQTRYITANITFLAVSDRATGNISVTQAQIRAVDGTGVTDTETLASTRTFSYQGSGGLIVFTVDAQSPPNMLVPISTSVPTDNIPLGVVDITSQGRDSTMTDMTLYVNTSVDTTTNISNVLRDIKVQSGALIYSADSIIYTTAGSVVTFNNMHIPLAKDQGVPVAILVDVNPDTNHSLDGISASTTLVASGTTGGADNNPVIVDSSFTTVDINDAPLLSSDITFSASDSHIDYLATSSMTFGAPTMNNNIATAYPVTAVFTLVAGDNTLYVSASANTALATSSIGLSSNSNAQLVDTTANPGTLAGDTSTYFVIPAGSSRQFTYRGFLSNTGGTSGLKTLEINGIRYGTDAGNLSADTVVYYNYATLKASIGF